MPAVANSDGPLERDVGVSPDPDRHVAGGLRLGADVVEAGAVDGKLGRDVVVGPHPSDHLDGFVGPWPALGERHAEGIELGFEPPGSGAEDHASATELVDGGDRLCHHDGAPHRQNEHRRADPHS